MVRIDAEFTKARTSAKVPRVIQNLSEKPPFCGK